MNTDACYLCEKPATEHEADTRACPGSESDYLMSEFAPHPLSLLWAYETGQDEGTSESDVGLLFPYRTVFALDPSHPAMRWALFDLDEDAPDGVGVAVAQLPTAIRSMHQAWRILDALAVGQRTTPKPIYEAQAVLGMALKGILGLGHGECLPDWLVGAPSTPAEHAVCDVMLLRAERSRTRDELIEALAKVSGDPKTLGLAPEFACELLGSAARTAKRLTNAT